MAAYHDFPANSAYCEICFRNFQPDMLKLKLNSSAPFSFWPRFFFPPSLMTSPMSGLAVGAASGATAGALAGGATGALPLASFKISLVREPFPNANKKI